MPTLVESTAGKSSSLLDREHNYEAIGRIIKDVHVVQDNRFTKFIQVIEWDEPVSVRGKREIRFCYYDRQNFPRALALINITTHTKKKLNTVVLRVQQILNKSARNTHRSCLLTT